MRTAAAVLVVLTLAACGSDGDDAVSSTGELTDAARAWCADHPREHGDAALELGIPFVGDFLRLTADGAGPLIADLEPPFLAIPATGDEPLTYTVLFESRDDSDRACRAAYDARS